MFPIGYSLLACCRGGQADSEGAYRVYLMKFPKSPVDWHVQYTGERPLNLDALQRACDRLVERHSSLRTVETPDEPMREAMDKVSVMHAFMGAS